MERYRRFIAVWFASRTQREVALALGMDRRKVQNVAAQLRRHGVLLPARRSGWPHSVGHGRSGWLDTGGWEELRQMADKLQGIETADRYRRGA